MKCRRILYIITFKLPQTIILIKGPTGKNYQQRTPLIRAGETHRNIKGKTLESLLTYTCNPTVVIILYRPIEQW